MRDSTVILGFYNGEKLSVQDSIKLDAQGKGIAKGVKPLPRGKYFLFINAEKRFDLLIGNEQKFSMSVDTTDILGSMKIVGSKENELLYNYINHIQDKIAQREKLTTEYKATTDEAAKKAIADRFSVLNTEVKQYIAQQIAANPNTFYAVQLKAAEEVEFPADLVAKNDRDALFRFFRAHYFDNINFADPGLIRTATLPQKIDDFLGKYTYQIPDSLYPAVDLLVSKARANKEMSQFMIMHLHDYFVTSENLELENVYIWFIEKYYIPEASWSDKTFIDKIKERAKKLKPILIGKFAPELTMDLWDPTMHEQFGALINYSRELESLNKLKDDKKATPADLAKITAYNDSISIQNSKIITNPKRKTKSLYDVKAKYTVLVFWEPDCSHCKVAMPKLHDEYNATLKARGVEVYAVCTQLKKGVWGEFLTKNNMFDWSNVWDPYNTSKFRDKYDITSTPIIFILSADKKILLKKVDVEQIDKALEYLDTRYK
jgi:thiol-disulfide isomerase/thioredoxin